MTLTDHDRSFDRPFVDVRRVGDATVAVVSEGEMLWAPRFPVSQAEWRRSLHDADTMGRIWLGLTVVLVRLDDGLIVIDPGLDDPGTVLEHDFVQRFAAWGIEAVRSPGLAVAMDRLGWEPEAVTAVVVTHAHDDHYAGVVVEREGELAVRFPNARHFIGRADWTTNPERERPDSDLRRRLGAVDALGLLELVDGDREIAPGVTLLPSPGETPGHLAVRVRSVGRSVYVLGDLIHHACEVEHPDWAPPGRDVATLRASRDRLFAGAAREEAVVVPAHERFPPWGRIVAAGDGFRWERA